MVTIMKDFKKDSPQSGLEKSKEASWKRGDVKRRVEFRQGKSRAFLVGEKA